MDRISDKKLLKIIGSLYDIANDASEEAWRQVYLDLSEFFRSRAGSFKIFDKEERSIRQFVGMPYSEAADEYLGRYQAESPFRDRISRLRAGDRFNRQEFMDDEAFRVHPMYERFYRKHGVFHLEYRVFLEYDRVQAGISFSRPEGEENFSGPELEAMDILMPHLARAFRTYFSLLEVRRESRIVKSAFDRIPQAVMIVGRDHRPLLVNSSAEKLISDERCFRKDKDGRIISVDGNPKISEMIDAVFGPREPGGTPLTNVALLETDSGARPLEVMVALYEGLKDSAIRPEPAAVIFVTDPGSRPATPEALMAIYGLTPAEAKVAVLLAEGLSVDEVAAHLGVSLNTARTHLKRAMAKTNTTRQTGLVKLVLSGTANLNWGKSEDFF